MIGETDKYYLNKEEPNKSCLLTLRNIILKQDTNITETQKWGMPCFCYKKKIFCYLWTDKKTDEPYILLVEGKHLDHPKLEKGKNNADLAPIIICAFEDCTNTWFQTSTRSLLLYLEWNRATLFTMFVCNFPTN